MNNFIKLAALSISALLASSTVAADNATLTLSSKAEYLEERVIAENIVKECTNLGFKFSESTRTSLEKNGFSVQTRSELADQAEGMSLKLTIVNALSAGNAFMGHKKSVSIQAELFQDGELLDTFERTRNSSGGFGAGFKGSCTVLERCVNTLGKDVARWMQEKHQG